MHRCVHVLWVTCAGSASSYTYRIQYHACMHHSRSDPCIHYTMSWCHGHAVHAVSCTWLQLEQFQPCEINVQRPPSLYLFARNADISISYNLYTCNIHMLNCNNFRHPYTNHINNIPNTIIGMYIHFLNYCWPRYDWAARTQTY